MDAAPLPEGLLERLRADPWRAPETIAAAAHDRHGPAAAAWLERQPARRRRNPERLAQRAVRFHARTARATGAAAGLAGAFGMVPDMATLAWLQSRMLVFVAAAFGCDPTHEDRAAEILVLQELAPDLPAARAAIDGSGPSVASHFVDRRLSKDEALVKVLFRMAFRQGAHRVAGRAIPGFAVLVNQWSNARETRALGARAIAYHRAARR